MKQIMLCAVVLALALGCKRPTGPSPMLEKAHVPCKSHGTCVAR